jgi:signal transduction histidine kinase
VKPMPSSTTDQYPKLLSLIAHELNTPMSVMMGFLRMVLRDSTEPLTPRQRHMIEEVEKSCARIVAVSKESSLIAKLDESSVKLAHEPLDLGVLLHDVAAHVHEASDRGVQLSLGGDLGAARMMGDAARLREAFHAIFRAILREKAGPTTVVADQRRERIDGRPYAVIVVADENSVQQSYARARATFNEYSTRRGGLGLALPLARRVFEGHGGYLWAPAPETGTDDEVDVLSRGSAIIALPLTE